ncbi:phosphotransferase [Aliifodinibius sp. S!AR15-10]|uniref:aminoglycoside phosphotransferase family protein n=1 Tax=Aliifodinibius sp. S!AR15-10 TaxID=2950437 RepID=UPI002855B7FD|nr:aminoglycoside phosphotransferase family protein [Aliifodinibius sp. S!AR15-10]MDR8390951.1 phosphotransferase [Aliifodinibius sp. S!AR15-10]
MDKKLVTALLREENLVLESPVKFRPLAGGVSSDISLVTDGQHSYVVKQALPKLQVEDDWFADIARNNIEQDFIRFMKKYQPNAVPELLYSDEEHHLFVMEYLDEDFQNWKQQMLKGEFDHNIARNAAGVLAGIHKKSWQNHDLKQQFDNESNFHSLRTEPYLITTGKHHPKLKQLFLEEAERLKHHREALVHGDFSPKNIMVEGDRVVLLDHEVAWFGDPAFDLAFFLNHLYLKMLHHYYKHEEIKDLTETVWKVYFNNVNNLNQNLEIRTGRLLQMLMLARVDGKSPVEYLEEGEKAFIRSFVHEWLPKQLFSQSEINMKWKSALKETQFED